MALLIDSSVLLAYAFNKDRNYQAARNFIHGLRNERVIVVSPVLNEVFYFITEHISYRRAILAFEEVESSFDVVVPIKRDWERMRAIMRQYADAELDFVDTAIMAVSERLNITRIATFDRRDFSMVRPAHTDHYELLP